MAIETSGAPTTPVGERSLAFPIISLEGGSSMEVTLPSEELEKAIRKARSHSESRVALLGLLLADLEGVPFEDVARLLQVKRVQRLEKMIHGTESIPKANEDRWLTIAEILRALHSVLKPSATARWLHTEVRGLGGKTPLAAIAKGGAEDVLKVVRTYRESAFS